MLIPVSSIARWLLVLQIRISRRMVFPHRRCLLPDSRPYSGDVYVGNELVKSEDLYKIVSKGASGSLVFLLVKSIRCILVLV